MSTYHEQHRLQFHFSPPEKWMNDPNGMVYHRGEYHLFYQYHPDSTVWGPMHWGHAVSKNLTHWQHLPIALYPDKFGYIFSGSAVVDTRNTSGFGTTDNPPLVAIFTYHDPVLDKQGSNIFQTQGIAYSTDAGRTWVKYEANPVLKNPGIRDFRDPKVFWMEAHGKWVMALAVKDKISFYSSPNLKEWIHESDFGQSIGAHGGVWECPDLFQLGDKWVLLVSINPGGPNGGSATQYFVGDFDGRSFQPQDNNTRWLDYGRDNYAGVTWSDLAKEDDRKIFMGWMSNWDYGNVVPTDKWRSAMTIPRELSLQNAGDAYIVRSFPVTELNELHTDEFEISDPIDLEKLTVDTYDLELTFVSNQMGAQNFGITLFNGQGDELIIGYDSAVKSFYINRDKAGKNDFAQNFNGIQTAGYAVIGNKLKWRLLVDVGSVELFVDDGALTMTALFFPQQPLDKLRLQPISGINVKGHLHKMKSIWE